MGTLTISMVIFNCYVKLPEGIWELDMALDSSIMLSWLNSLGEFYGLSMFILDIARYSAI